ncbi:MAG: hypothetical protein IJ880_01815 [Bacilli bacterium]|nr:hypothetical protein [Bacilli bacterium]
MMTRSNDINVMTSLEEIEKQLKIQNKLELLKIAREAGICSEEDYKNSLKECCKVMFGTKK